MKTRRPTKLSIKIAKRLIEEVGINLDLIPENYVVIRDQKAIGLNKTGGMDWPIWYLAEPVDIGVFSPAIHVAGKEFEINSAVPASKIATAKKIEIIKTYNVINLYDA